MNKATIENHDAQEYSVKEIYAQIIFKSKRFNRLKKPIIPCIHCMRVLSS
jgi:hypothetical protein